MSEAAFAGQLADRLGYPQLTPAIVRAWEQGKATPPAAAVHAALGLVQSSAGPAVTLGDQHAQDTRVPQLGAPASHAQRLDELLPPGGELGVTVHRALMLDRSATNAAHARCSAHASVTASREWLVRHLHDSRSDVQMTTPAALAGAFSAFQDLDTRQGGGHARHALTGYLTGAVLPHLDPAQRGSREPGLRLGLSELLYLTGLTAFDTGALAQAQAYFIEALQLADEDGAQPFAANLMAAMSHLAVTAGQPREAVQLATAGLIASSAVPLPPVRMRLHLMHARGLALLHEPRACSAEIRLAEAEHELAADADTPPWARYLDTAYLAGELSLCYRDLSQPRQAIRCAEQSIATSKHRARRRLLSYAALASAHARAGEFDHACGAGHRALDLLDRGMRSWRGQREILRLPQLMTPAHEFREAREFRERLHDLTD